MLPQKYCKIWYDETEKPISHPGGDAAGGFGGGAEPQTSPAVVLLD